MLKTALSSKLGTFTFVVFAYGFIQWVNNFLSDFLHLVPVAQLIDIPSGFKFLFVLVAGWVGALGVCVASLVAAVFDKFSDQWVLRAELACINGLAPLLARKLIIENFALNEDLSNITMKQVFLMGLLFVFLNSGLNQLILFWNDVSDNFLDGVLVMLISDLTGTYFVLSVLKLVIQRWGVPDKLGEK